MLPVALLWLAWQSTVLAAAASLALCHAQLPVDPLGRPFLGQCSAAACSIAGPASAVLASKCLKGKPATVAKAGEACMQLIELEQQAAVIEAVLKAFGDKVPKVVLAAVDIVLQAVRWAWWMAAASYVAT